MNRPVLLVGNWKMNGSHASLDELAAIDRAAAYAVGVNIVICPPATLIQRACALSVQIEIGAQDCFSIDRGAFTGRLSPTLLRDAGATWVIVGHSECRAAGDVDEHVRAKAELALAGGLNAIVCVGETLEDRDRGVDAEIIRSQLIGSLPRIDDASSITIAYEPVWAIGTGRTPTTAQIAGIHSQIRAVLVNHFGDVGQLPSILYGGSVNGANSAELVTIQGVDGLLVGGASLSAATFLPIIDAVTPRGA